MIEVELPPSLHAIEIPMWDGQAFRLVVSREAPGPYERYLVSSPVLSENAMLICSLLKDGGALIDLGANIGTIALPVAVAGGSVVAVEMLPENCLKLTLAGLVNRLRRLRVVQAAASDVDGLLSFDGTEAWGAVATNGVQRAIALSLDTIIAGVELADPHFLRGELVLKLDIEGYEYQALLGASRLLKRRPITMFESIETEGVRGVGFDCKLLFERHGYRLFMLRGPVLVPKSSEDVQEEHVSDFLAVPAERVDEIARRLRSRWEIRQPAQEEAILWMEASAFHSPNHRTHVQRVLSRLSESDPIFAQKCQKLRESLDAPAPTYLYAEFPRLADVPQL